MAAMTKKRVTRRFNLMTQVLLMAAILVAANIIASKRFFRLDFTQDKAYTLAQSSKRILKDLPDMVTINAYFSANLPPYMTTLKSGVRDLLDEYRAYAGANIQVRFITPDDDEATEQKMRMAGIPRVSLNVFDKDQFQVSQVYLGMTVVYQGKKETLPVIQGLEELEYQISSAILKVIREAPITIALAAPEENDMGEEGAKYDLLEQELRRQYEVIRYSFGADGPIPDSVSAMMALGPKDLKETDLYRLDQFVARGGRLLLAVDTFDFDASGLMPHPVGHGLEPLLRAWGVVVKPEVVIDPQSNALATFSRGFLNFRVPYPFWPNVPPQGFDKDHPIVNSLESLVMPWTSPLSVEPAEDLKAAKLAVSSPASWARGEPYDFSPTQKFDGEGRAQESQTLALLLTGAAPRAYNGEAIPAAIPDAEKKAHLDKGKASAILVTGNSRFARDEVVTRFNGNALFVMNAVDWLAQSQDLIGIRSRGSLGRPLPDLSERAKSLIRYLNICAVSGLLLVIGGVRFLVRQRWARRVL